MATFFEGSRGSGKSKYAIERMQNRLKSGRAVATNLDLFLDKLWPENTKAHYVRLPDFPRSIDLLGLGKAYKELDFDDPNTYNDKKFGCVVLDELLTSFNSRNWNDPDRIEVVNWIVQSRKHGWDLCLIGQSIDAIDKQIKETVIDELYSFRSSVNMFPGLFWKMLIAPWFNKLVPKFHLVTKYDGRKKDKNQKIGGDHFRRNDLHECYKTGQQFKKDVRVVVSGNGKKPKEIDLRASYSVLHPHYFNKPVKQEVSEVPEKNKKNQPIANQSNPILLFGLMLFAMTGYYYINDWSTTIQAQKNKELIGGVGANKISAIKEKDTSSLISNSDLGHLFVSCHVFSTSGDFDYCFNNKDGSTVYPQDVGYKVLYKSECHAKLIRDDSVYDVYCNPVRRTINRKEPLENSTINN